MVKIKYLKPLSLASFAQYKTNKYINIKTDIAKLVNMKVKNIFTPKASWANKASFKKLYKKWNPIVTRIDLLYSNIRPVIKPNTKAFITNKRSIGSVVEIKRKILKAEKINVVNKTLLIGE